MPIRKKLFQFNNKRQLTKAKLLLLGALLFSFGVGTSVAATYAYYTLQEFYGVTGLNLQIDMSDATIRLKLEGQDGQIIDHEGGYSKEELDIEGIELTDVSGMYQSSWMNENTDASSALPELRSSYRGSGSIKDTGKAIEGKDVYVQNVFYFDSTMDCTIYLDSSSYVTANHEENLKTAKGDIEKAAKLDRVSESVRVSFYSEDLNDTELTNDEYSSGNSRYLIAKNHTKDVRYGGVLDLNGDGYYDYDGNTNKELLYGEYYGDPSYLPAETSEKAPYPKGNVFKAEHKQGVMKAGEENSSINDPMITLEKALPINSLYYREDDPFFDAPPITTVHKGVDKRIVISVYVEGWDREMTDDIASACFDINISFTALFNDPFYER